MHIVRRIYIVTKLLKLSSHLMCKSKLKFCSCTGRAALLSLSVYALGVVRAGIWVGLMSLIACNFVGDSIRITRKDSPVAAVLDLDVGLSFDETDEGGDYGSPR